MADNKNNKPDANAVPVNKSQDENLEEAIARTFLRPSVNSSRIIKKLHSEDDRVVVSELVKALGAQSKRANEGDLKSAEAMLMSQAHTLDALFSEISIRALNNRGNYDWFKAYMNSALKIQNQCRMTIGTLAEIKNPKPYIQNNKAQYQQVNNRLQEQYAPARTEEKPKSANELLENNSHDKQWMDTGKTKETSRSDTDMETVGK